MTSNAEAWVPAFEGQRPPFQPGHSLSVKSGAEGELTIEQPAAEWMERLRDIVPVAHRSDEPLIALTARVLARLDAAHTWLAEQPFGIFRNDRGELQAVLKAVSTWENSAARFLGMLGCSPTTRAQLGLDVALAQRAGAELLDRYRDGGDA